MNVLLIGSGGREHALAWAISASPLLGKLYCAPGNAGIAEVAECLGLDVADHAAVVAFCRDNAIDLVVIGPEGPLVAGLADDLAAARIKVFGPSKAAAQLEGSKGFTKDLCREFSIPTGAYGRFRDAPAAKAYLAGQTLPIVIKADGLAAGKGVVIAETKADAEAAIDACFAGAFGAAGAEIVIEEFLEGEEASVFALVDGRHVLPLASAQDHKRVGDGDIGPNTGGMGAYSPAPVMTPEMIAPACWTRSSSRPCAPWPPRASPTRACSMLGVMITEDGPKLYEYNVRFGDPECQVLMMRLKADLLPAAGRHRRRRARDASSCVGTTSRRSPWSWRPRAIPATTATARRSAASMRRVRCRASKSSTPAPARRATDCSPPAAASSTSRRAARPWRKRSSAPTTPSPRSTGPAASTAPTSAGAPSPASATAGEHASSLSPLCGERVGVRGGEQTPRPGMRPPLTLTLSPLKKWGEGTPCEVIRGRAWPLLCAISAASRSSRQRCLSRTCCGEGDRPQLATARLTLSLPHSSGVTGWEASSANTAPKRAQ